MIRKTSIALTAIIALLHLWFMVLEMVFWTKPLGLQTFHRTQEQADSSAGLAMNQGLYNGFLAAGLIWSITLGAKPHAVPVRIFFLACILVAGVFGGFTANPSIFAVQAAPALIALGLVLASRPRPAG